jgi:hypothetical protein
MAKIVANRFRMTFDKDQHLTTNSDHLSKMPRFQSELSRWFMSADTEVPLLLYEKSDLAR